ncbi:RNase adapter RapZ [Demequina sp. NBRC 110051]|uniref:RNase adapter RapZ n=1 Tax=Demequina sp. NBRC 110051 TaxID=1570340 RepID=UPI0009FBC25D|nr:RNase adapter RapZ [Demequina sp. NBRC 110051]
MTDDPHPPTYPSGIPRLPAAQAGSAAEVLVLTGMSGAGRTRAAAVLADLGWYVVDNLPPHLLAGLVDSVVGSDASRKLAAVVDARGGAFFEDLEPVVDDLEARGISVRMVFLDASDDALVRRFEEARRPHPLQADGTILEGIGRERSKLSAIRRASDHVIDTSRLNVHELRELMTDRIAEEMPRLHVNVQSFGFKNGLPADADFVADVRFLANPHWDPELKPLTGLDPAVRDHVLGGVGAQEFLDGYTGVIDGALRHYRAHDKPSVTIGVGCTGGKHRSVAIAEELGSRLRERGYDVRVTHRDRPQS